MGTKSHHKLHSLDDLVSNATWGPQILINFIRLVLLDIVGTHWLSLRLPIWGTLTGPLDRSRVHHWITVKNRSDFRSWEENLSLCRWSPNARGKFASKRADRANSFFEWRFSWITQIWTKLALNSQMSEPWRMTAGQKTNNWSPTSRWATGGPFQILRNSLAPHRQPFVGDSLLKAGLWSVSRDLWRKQIIRSPVFLRRSLKWSMATKRRACTLVSTDSPSLGYQWRQDQKVKLCISYGEDSTQVSCIIMDILDKLAGSASVFLSKMTAFE